MERNANGSALAGKRVLSCYVSAEYGGLASTFVSITNALAQSGGRITIVLQRLEGELLDQFAPDIDVIGLGYSGPYSYPKMLNRMIALVRHIRPHVITSHAWNTSILAVLASYTCRPRPRIVLFEHTSSAFYRLGGGWRGFFKGATLSPLYRQAEALVVVSEGIRQDYQNRYSIDGHRISVIPPPVDVEGVLEKAKEAVEHPWFDNSKPIILSAAPLYSWKDFPTLLKAFVSVCRTRPSRLVIVGDGPEKDKLENLASKLGISDNFCILGYQANPYKYMVHASVFALSSMVEGFGKVLVEALALGLPVVSTNCHGPIDILENGRYGFLVPVGDSEAMANAILRLLDDTELCSSLKTSGPLRARTYRQTVSLGKIERLIADVVSTR